jgi:hypothetical protein
MKSVKEALTGADRKSVLDDVVALIDSEVSKKSGLSGMALKAGYKVVKKLKGGRMIHMATNHMLNDFTAAIAPLHEEFRAADGSGFAAFLVSNDVRAAEALLGITDQRAARAQTKVLKKTYSKLRPQALGHVKEALPALGHLIDKYAG